jgi:hypothetical protein
MSLNTVHQIPQGCIDSSPLRGICCTNQCVHHDMCNLKRIPILIRIISVRGHIISRESAISFFIRQQIVWHSGHPKHLIYRPDTELNWIFHDNNTKVSMLP